MSTEATKKPQAPRGRKKAPPAPIVPQVPLMELPAEEPSATATWISAGPALAPTATKTRGRSVCELLLDSNESVPVSVELQERAVALVGREIFERALAVSQNDTAHFCAIMADFARFKRAHPDASIPTNWHRDPYWDVPADERIAMLDAAFAVQDDDAELKSVQPGEHKCKKCGSNRVLLHLRQLRSGDEAMTQLFKCAECKNKWIIH